MKSQELDYTSENAAKMRCCMEVQRLQIGTYWRSTPTSLILEVQLNLEYCSSSRSILKAIEISTMKGGERKKKIRQVSSTQVSNGEVKWYS